jgi:hypothetical protein
MLCLSENKSLLENKKMIDSSRNKIEEIYHGTAGRNGKIYPRIARMNTNILTMEDINLRQGDG